MAQKLSGQVTVTTAGTAVAATTPPSGNKFRIRAHTGNTGFIYVGNDGAGDVTSSNGFELDAGEWLEYCGELSDLRFDSSVNGEKACWIKVA